MTVFRGCVGTEDPTIQLSEIHTKALLRFLVRGWHGGPEDNPYAMVLVYRCGQSGYKWFHNPEIRAELAKREHVPNKREARAVRQEKARKGQRSERRRR